MVSLYPREEWALIIRCPCRGNLNLTEAAALCIPLARCCSQWLQAIYKLLTSTGHRPAARLLTVRTWECVCMSGLEGTREKENGKLAHTCNRPLNTNTNNEVFVLLLSRWRRRYALLGVIQLLPWWTFRLHIPLRTCGHLCLSLLVFCTPEL